MPGDAAVVREALVDDDELARRSASASSFSASSPPIGTKWSFFDEKTAPSAQARDLADDRRERAVRVAGLALLDEERVLRDPRRVEDQRHAVRARELADAAQVLDRERLAAGHVQAGLLADEGDAARRRPREHALERDRGRCSP